MAKNSTHFDIKILKNRKKEFYWKKTSENNKQISKSSEGYDTKAKALNGLRVDTIITLKAINAVVPYPLSIVYFDTTLKEPSDKILVVKK